MGGSAVVRGTVLRWWGHGESHQRTICAVRRPSERSYDASQSTAAVPIGDGLLAGFWPATLGVARDTMGRRAGGHSSFTVAEDWGANSGDCAQSLGPDGQQFSAASAVSSGAAATALLSRRRPPGHLLFDNPQGPDTAWEVVCPRRLKAGRNGLGFTRFRPNL